MAGLIDLERDQILIGDLRNFERLFDIVNPSQDEVRLHAAAVRRLLLDQVLPAVAGSRNMPLRFQVPDAKPWERAARNRHLISFSLAGVKAFGIEVSGACLSSGGPVRIDFDPSKPVSLSIDSFLKQTVAFIGGEFITRRELIGYVANKAGGVHYDPSSDKRIPENKYRALGLLRKSLRIGIQDGVPTISFSPPIQEDQSEQFRYEPQYVDAVYLEFLACIGFILNSPEVQEIRKQILRDINLPNP